MAKNKYELYVLPKFNEIKQLVQEGATDKEVMDFLGVKKSAFYEYMSKYPEFMELMRNSRKQRIRELKNSLFKKAMGFQFQEVEEVTDSEGYTKKIVRTKTSPPSETAILILLKHWDRNEDGSPKWMNDPATYLLKLEELKLKRENAEKEDW